MKKTISAVLALGVVATSILAGCGSAPASSTAASGAVSTASGAASGGKLSIAALQSAYKEDMWQNLIDAFKKDNPGVEITLTADKKLEDVLETPMKSGTYPDLVFLSLGREKAMTETLIKENAVEEITDVLNMKVPGETKTVKEKMTPGITDGSSLHPYGGDKLYLMPDFYSPCGLFYNTKLLKDNGWETPKTWDEMWALGDKAKEKGIALFAYPTTGYFDAFTYAMMANAGGPEFLNKAANYTEGVWSSAEAKTVFDTIYKLSSEYTEKSVPSNANDDNYLKNQQLILDGKAIFMPNGTWVTGEMKDAPRTDGFEWGFMPVPAFKDGGDQYVYTFTEQCWIPSGAANKDLAKQFMAFLYSDKAVQICADAGAAVPVQGVSDKLAGENKLFYSIYDQKGVSGVVADAFVTTDPVEGVSIKDSFFAAVDSLVSGSKTQDQWVEGITKASDALRAAKK